MKLKQYTPPRIAFEKFIPNEYVAACWFIACSVPETGTNHYTVSSGQYAGSSFGQDTGGQWHAKYASGKGCGHADNQHIYDNADGSFSIIEENTPSGSALDCKITNNPTSIEQGTYIEWTTVDGGTYYHHGTVTLEDQSRPLHS